MKALNPILQTVAPVLAFFVFASEALGRMYMPGEEPEPESPWNIFIYRIILAVVITGALIVLGAFIYRLNGRYFQKRISRR